MNDASVSSLQREIDANDPKWSNPCRRMIACFAALGSDKQRAAHELWRDTGEEARCEQNLLALPSGARQAIEAALALCPPQENLCHDNAWRIATRCPNISMRSGWANGVIPMEHSWCQLDWNGVLYDFDPTDIALFDGRSFQDHFCLATVDRKQALFWGAALGHSGPYCNEIAAVELGWRLMEDFSPAGAPLKPAPMVRKQKTSAAGAISEPRSRSAAPLKRRSP